jgi:putative tricarboxylic transport membrane protein
MMERSFREAMMISRGDVTVFVTRPISATLLTVGVLVMAVPPLLVLVRGKRPAQVAN